MSKTEALRAAAAEALRIFDWLARRSIYTDADMAAVHANLRTALAQQPAASGEPAEPLKGWKLNHAQKGPEDGMAEIGYLDPEDDRFSPILTVDTGLYYQADQAMPLAVAILGALADAAPQPAPARVPLTEAHVEANSPAGLSHAHWFRLGVRWAEGQHYINGTWQATPEQGEPK